MSGDSAFFLKEEKGMRISRVPVFNGPRGPRKEEQ